MFRPCLSLFLAISFLVSGILAIQAQLATSPQIPEPAAKLPGTTEPDKAVPVQKVADPVPALDKPPLDQPAADRKDPNLKRLSPNWDVWIDAKNKRVVLEATVCLTEGQLEMFACTRRTKEHESVLTVLTTAQAVHAALIAVGAKAGKPVQFDPKYVTATGQEIEIELSWTDAAGKEQKCRAQDWIKDANTNKPMTHPWVFAGSGFYVDEMTGKRQYLADSGDFICVSNFSSAMMDLPIKSTDQADAGLMFEAMSEKIPAKGTKVTMTLIPKPDAKPQAKPLTPVVPMSPPVPAPK